MSSDSTGATRLLPTSHSTLGYLFWLSRPRFWFYLAGPLIVGVVYAASTPADVLHPLTIALFLYFLLPANVFLYGVNDIFDADIDTENPKKAADGREVRYGGDRVVSGVVGASAILGLLFVPWIPFEAAGALVGFLALGLAYSAPPVRFKTTPLLDSLSNGLYILPALVGYGAVSGGLPPLPAIIGGWLWAMAMHTFSAIPDIEPDRTAGIRTTATVLGERRALWYCGCCWAFATVAMGVVHPAFVAIFGMYPVVVLGVAAFDISIDQAYWWFPALNTVAGALLTIGGLWVITYG